MKYHIGKNGPRECRATVRNCPIGGEHFENYGDAERAYSKVNETFNSLSKITQKVHLSSNFIDGDFTDGDLSDPNARMALVTGYCGDLAKEIIKIRGGRPVFLSHDYYMTEEKLEENFRINPNSVFQAPHVMVTTDEAGVYLDAYGPKTLEEVEENFEDSKPVIGSMEMLEEWCKNSTGPDLKNFAKSAIKLYDSGKSYDYDDELDEFEFDDDDYDDE